MRSTSGHWHQPSRLSRVSSAVFESWVCLALAAASSASSALPSGTAAAAAAALSSATTAEPAKPSADEAAVADAVPAPELPSEGSADHGGWRLLVRSGGGTVTAVPY
jgi:guanyl-specific ribonuclease Sa